MDLLKELFADPSNSLEAHLSQFNKYFEDIGQITYYFASYFSLTRSGTFNLLTDHIRFVVPCGNFGDILAGFFAKRMSPYIETHRDK